MLINYYIEKANDAGSSVVSKSKKKGKGERIKVDDNTATGGWY